MRPARVGGPCTTYSKNIEKHDIVHTNDIGWMVGSF